MLNQNLNIFSHRSEFVKQISLSEDLYTIEYSRDGFPTAVRNSDRQWLESRYSPVTEAKRWIENQKFESSDLPLILGFSPAILSALKHRPVVVVERDASMLKAYLDKVELTSQLSGVTLLLDEDGFDTMSALRNAFDPFRHLRIKPALVPLYASLNDKWAHSIVTTALKVQREVSLNALSYSYQLPLWTKTVRKNMSEWINSPEASFLEGILKDKTAVIVCAGPSLEKNINYLKLFRGKAAIIAVDTALRRLDRAGIMPDIAVAVDANEHNAKDVRGLSEEMLNSILIADTISAPAIVQAFKGPKAFLRCINFSLDLDGKPLPLSFPLDNLILEIIGREFLPSWQSGGSVSTNAFALAGIMKAKRVIFAGQDLAFTGKKTHVAGVAYEDDMTEMISRFSSRESQEFKLHAGDEVFVEAWDGAKVQTNSTMREYLGWFELTIERGFAKGLEVIDATEGGAKKNGMIPMKLRDIAELCGSERFDVESLRARMKSTRPLGNHGWEKRFSNLIERAKKLSGKPDEILEKCPMAKWLALPAFIGSKDFSESERKSLIESGLISAIEFLIRVGEGLEH